MKLEKVILNYHGDGGQACTYEKMVARSDDPEALMKMVKLMNKEFKDNDHSCNHKGLSFEFEPVQRKSYKVT